MSTENVLNDNNICSKCHTLLSSTHECVEDNIICTRFYTYDELIERSKRRKVEYVYIKRRVTHTRPQTR
jgi:hypothetical protein